LDDALSLLEVKGLVQQSPHPIADFAVYYLTVNGREALQDSVHLPGELRERLAKAARIAANQKTVPADLADCTRP
jgi:hypothetical protein